MQVYDSVSAVDLPALEDGQLYLYVLENAPQGNIKIGRTKNIMRRLRSLSGSNTGGNTLVRIAVSSPTYLYTLERLAHWAFAAYRIPGTEWFCGEDLKFSEVCAYIDGLFQRPEYTVCNEMRKQFYALHKITHTEEEELEKPVFGTLRLADVR